MNTSNRGGGVRVWSNEPIVDIDGSSSNRHFRNGGTIPAGPSSSFNMSSAPLGGSSTSSVACRYYPRGMCRFGEFCRFAHIGTPSISDSNNSSNDSYYLDLSVNSSPTPTSSGHSRNNNNNNNNSNNNNRNIDIKPSDPTSWVMAPVFVPKQPITIDDDNGSAGINSDTDVVTDNDEMPNNNQDEPKSYAEVLGGGACGGVNYGTELCIYAENCHYGNLCPYKHGELCDMCGRYCLHPTDKEQRRKHTTECILRHERDMELSFAIARSKDKTCGVCFDIIMEKAGREQRFGILPNCNHIFCLQCIRKWRQAKQFDNKIIRACPECRTPSDFVCPSAFWVETKEEKDKLITDYKSALGDKDCKYFKKGAGKCPFGNKCFYKHALPNGARVDVGVPQRNVRKVQRRDAENLDLFDIYLYDFVERREYHWLDFLSYLSDSDDSDWSDE